MKKFLIMLFITLSGFIVMSCFITKSRNQEPIGFSYVLNQLKDADIGFDIQQDISELSISLQSLNDNTSYASNDILNAVVSIGKTIYYFSRFAIKLIVHTIVATMNVIICVLKCIGFVDMDYVHIWSAIEPTGGGGGRGNTPLIY